MAKKVYYSILILVVVVCGIIFLPRTSFADCTLAQIKSVSIVQDEFLCNDEPLSLLKFKELLLRIDEKNNQDIMLFQSFYHLLGGKLYDDKLTKHKFKNIKKIMLKRINKSQNDQKLDISFIENLSQDIIKNNLVSLIKKMDTINSDKEYDTCEIEHKGNSIKINFDTVVKMYASRKNEKKIDVNSVSLIDDRNGKKYFIKDMNLDDLMSVIQAKSRYLQDSDSRLLLEYLNNRYQTMKKTKKGDPCLEGIVKTAILFERKLMNQYADKCDDARGQKLKIDKTFFDSFISEHSNESMKFDREYAIRRAVYMRKLFESYQKNGFFAKDSNEKNYIPFFQYLGLFYDSKRQANGLNLWVDEGMREASKHLRSMKLPDDSLNLFDKNYSEESDGKLQHWGKVFFEAELLAKKQIFPSTAGTIPSSATSFQGKELQKDIEEIARRNDIFFTTQREQFSNKGLLKNEELSEALNLIPLPPVSVPISNSASLPVMTTIPIVAPTPIVVTPPSSSIVRFDLSSAGVKAILDQVNQTSAPFINILNETSVTDNLHLLTSVPITKSETACLQAYEESRKIIGEAYPSIKDNPGALNTVVMLVNFQDCPRIPKSLLGLDLKGYTEPVANTFFKLVSPMANMLTSAYSCVRSDYLNQMRSEACRENFINKMKEYIDYDYSLKIVHPEIDPNYCSYSMFEAPGIPGSDDYSLFEINPKKSFDRVADLSSGICSSGFNKARTLCSNVINSPCVTKFGIHMLAELFRFIDSPLNYIAPLGYEKTNNGPSFMGVSFSTFDPIASSVLLDVKSNDIVNNSMKIDKMNISRVDNNKLKVIIDLKEMSVNAKLGLGTIENNQSRTIGEYPVKLEIRNNPQISVDVDISNISAPKIENLKIIPKENSQKLTFLGSPDDKSVMAGLLRSVTNLNEGLINNIVNDSVDLAIQYVVGPKTTEYLNDQIATFSKNIFDDKNTKLELRDLMEVSNIANFPSLLQRITALIAMENFIQNTDFNNVTDGNKKLLKVIAIKKTLREKIVRKLRKGTPFDPDPSSIHEVENDLNDIIKMFTEEDLNKLKSGNRNIVYKTALYTLVNLLESSKTSLEKKLADNDNAIPAPYRAMLTQSNNKMLSQINLYKGLLSREIGEGERGADRRDEQTHLLVNAKTEDIEIEFKKISENPVPKIEVYKPDGQLNNCYHSVFSISPQFINSSINIMTNKFPKMFNDKGLVPTLEIDGGKSYLKIMGQRIHLDKCLQTGSNCFDSTLIKMSKNLSAEVLSSIYFVINYIREIISAKLHNFWQAHGLNEHLITRTVRDENLSQTVKNISPKLVGTHFSDKGLYFFVNFLNSQSPEGREAQACLFENSSFVER